MDATVYLMYKLSTERKRFQNFTLSHMNIFHSPCKNQPERTLLLSLSTGSESLVCPALVAAWACETTLSSAVQSIRVAKPHQSRVQKMWKYTSLRILQAVKPARSMCANKHTKKGIKASFQLKKISGNTKATLKGSFICLISFHRHILKLEKCHKF